VPTLDNGGWVPEDHPLWLDEQTRKKGTQQAGAAAADPTAAPVDTYAAPAPASGGGEMTPAQAAAAGLGWVDKNHPLYGTPGYAGSAPAGAGVAGPFPATPGGPYAPPNLAPNTPGPNALDTQTSNAQTYSQTPGAAPSNATTNQGTQDAVRNTYLGQIQKGTAVDTNDPNFRMQSDAFAAAQERARRNQLDDSAQASFQAGTRGSGGDLVERRMADETSARNVGQFEGALVGRELESRRDEIKNALSSLGGMIGDDQKMALNRELAALDAAIKREGITSQGDIAKGQLALGGQELGVKDKLGTGALNVDLLRALLQNQQFGTDAGIRIGDLEAKYSGLF
jgi:hypothetical protein